MRCHAVSPIGITFLITGRLV
ncbi:hypothetical protein D043_2300A, partial [Vibrio parahaemolyticus EKP-021]